MAQKRYRFKPKAPDTRDIGIGRRIRLRRLIIKLSEAELANTLGVTTRQVQKYEKGLSRIGVSQLANIAEALNVPITYFYDGKVKLLKVKAKGVAEAANEALPLLRTASAVRVARAFAKMTPEIRKHFLALVEEIAARQAAPPEGGGGDDQ
jgi:transcriptional regulator with XRE-family HTH domain